MGARDFRVSFQFRNETTAVVARVGSILDANQLNKRRQDKISESSLLSLIKNYSGVKNLGSL